MKASIVILDAIEPGQTPDYCTIGRVTCAGDCGNWLWLGDETSRIVLDGVAYPYCPPCARRIVPSGDLPYMTLKDSKKDA